MIVMKKTLFIFALMLLMACGTYKVATVDHLKTGMSKAEVEHIFGPSGRILAVSRHEYGYREILEYKIAGSGWYALDFVNDRLTRYEFLRDDVEFVPMPPPPPVIVVNPVSPSHPANTDIAPSRPSARPGRRERSDVGQGRTERPSVSSRPGNNARPSETVHAGTNRTESTGNANPGRSYDNNRESREPSRQTASKSPENSTQTSRPSSTGNSSGRRR
jgi:hypothetical protein